MEIRTDFTALVLPTPAELELATERARLVADAKVRIPRRSIRMPFFRRHHAVAR